MHFVSPVANGLAIFSIPTGLRPKAQGWNASFLPWVADHINSSNPNGVVSADLIGLTPRHISRPIPRRAF